MESPWRWWESAVDGLEVAEFPSWTPTLDDALRELQDLGHCPGDVYRALAEPRPDVAKLTVLVCDRDVPIWLSPLKFRTGEWQPATNWIVPGLPFASIGAGLPPILHAIGLPMALAWWRCPVEPPASRRIEATPPAPTYRLPCDVDAEHLWHRTGLWPTVRQARRKCQSLRVAADEPGTAEWVIRQWGMKWGVRPDSLDDRRVAAQVLERAGRHHTLVFYDGDRRAGGLTVVEHQGDVVGQTVFRDPEYDKWSLGNFMLDRLVFWAAAAGFRGVDFGGTGAYKRRWAPVGGRKYSVYVTPLYRRVANRVGALTNALRGAPGRPAQPGSPAAEDAELASF